MNYISVEKLVAKLNKLDPKAIVYFGEDSDIVPITNVKIVRKGNKDEDGIIALSH